MKTIKYILYALTATFVLASCSDDIKYTPGDGEDTDCYGVYFPSQENAGDQELDPAEPTTLTFTAMRKNYNDAITVPVEVSSTQDGLFTVSEIKFEAGQEATTFSVDFPGAEVGKTYDCSIVVKDKKYALLYGEYSNGLDFSVTRVQWDLVKGPNGETKGTWRDDFFTAIMGSNIKENGVPNAEKEVEIYERADMKGYYRIKDIYASYGEEILQGCTFDGKLMAFPETNISDGPNLLWVRKDWMEKLGLSVPETIDDVKHIALTFAEENPANQEMGNIGLAVSTTLYGGTGISSEYGMNLIFASFGAYPGRWLTDAEGMPVYGSVQPNVKDALGMLADWYQEGVLDRDFLIRTQDDIAELIAQGRCGIFFAPWWAPNNPLWRCHETDPEADWQPFLIRTGKDGSVRYCNEKLTGNYVVVRKGYEYPEIVPKILSVMFDYMRYSYDDPRGEFQQYYTGNIDPTARPLAINLDYNQALTICYENLQAALNGEKSEDELEILERSFEKVCRAYLENPKTASAEEWSAYLSRITACSLLSDEKIQRVNTIYPTRTKTTETYRYTLKELESETFLKIIRGESELSSFDDFVKEWQEEGGNEIIQEMIQERKSLSSQENQKTEEKAEQKAE